MLREKVELLEQKLRMLEAEPGPSTLQPSHSRISTVTSQQSGETSVDVIGDIHYDDLSAIPSTMNLELEDAGSRNFFELFNPSGSLTPLGTFVNPKIDFLHPLSTKGSPLLPPVTLTEYSDMESSEGTLRYSINTPLNLDRTIDSSQNSKQIL